LPASAPGQIARPEKDSDRARDPFVIVQHRVTTRGRAADDMDENIDAAELFHRGPAGRSLVALDLLQRFPQIVTLDNSFHRRPASRRAFEAGFRRTGFDLLGGGALGFTRHPVPKFSST
jgi:hypothetical protein